ncbi:MAG: hypothetical protein OXC83_00480 [Chloroflexi bacterium]|nr:hypothetical protein [Chloroflexota bacterium]
MNKEASIGRLVQKAKANSEAIAVVESELDDRRKILQRMASAMEQYASGFRMDEGSNWSNRPDVDLDIVRDVFDLVDKLTELQNDKIDIDRCLEKAGLKGLAL